MIEYKIKLKKRALKSIIVWKHHLRLYSL